MQMLETIIQFFESNLLASVGVIATVAEFAFRLLPTKKPISIMLAVSMAFKKLAKLFDLAAAFLDKIIPQHLIKEDNSAKK